LPFAKKAIFNKEQNLILVAYRNTLVGYLAKSLKRLAVS
jgi:hypothetical protein